MQVNKTLRHGRRRSGGAGSRSAARVSVLQAELEECRTLLSAARRRADQAEREVEAHVQRCKRLHHAAKQQRQVPSLYS